MSKQAMWLQVLGFSVLMLVAPTFSLADTPLGKSRNQMIRLQTVDPLAENRVPTQSPPFSGKKATKAIKQEHIGLEQKKIKQNDAVRISK